MAYDLILPILPLAIGMILGSAVKQLVEFVYNIYFKVEQTAEKVFSTALMIRDSGILMVQESYETAVMLFRNVLDGVLMIRESFENAVMLFRNMLGGILMPILNATQELILLIKPVLDVAIVVMKTVILVIRQAFEMIQLIVNATSALLTTIFTSIYSFATNTTATVSSWTSWMYKGSSDTFFYTLLYLFGFYALAHISILVTKRLVKKIK